MSTSDHTEPTVDEVAEATPEPAAVTPKAKKAPASRAKAKTPVVEVDAAVESPRGGRRLFASVGAGTQALDAARSLQTRASELAKTRSEALQAQAKELGDNVRASVKDFPGTVQELRDQISATVTNLPTLVQERATTLQGVATSRYESLSAHGEKLVGSIRSQASTQQAEKAYELALEQAKTAREAAAKAAQAAAQAAKAAASAVSSVAGRIG